MRLKHIKLSGFKSFVDPTTVLLPTSLTAIVGPNGCGKSNIIDAVRWVMGESSAKQLRGESLGDVIFNGSSNRKPISQASIELSFDNSDQTLTGPYAAYSEISLRREISREGQSNYFLNGSRCRRRDITDLFLGTGLGPRSYAIIEQGMISRLIEAKPADLRNYIEEAAGISKYKERRHETELRIHHTNENLARLNDIREELEKQLNHLQRQANAAEKYKILKEEERLLKAQIYALRWKSLNEQLSTQQTAIQEHETALTTYLQQQQELLGSLDAARQQQAHLIHRNNDLQNQYFEKSSEFNRLEQSIQSQQERRDQWQEESRTIDESLQINQSQLTASEQLIEKLSVEKQRILPITTEAKNTLAQSVELLADAEKEKTNWQHQWDHFNQKVAQTSQQIEVDQTRLQHLAQRIQQNQQRLQRMQAEQHQQELELGHLPQHDFDQQIEELQQQRSVLENDIQAIIASINDLRLQQQHLTKELESSKNSSHRLREQLASLEAMQQVALGKHEEAAMGWLQKQQLADKPRFAQLLQVESGWEQAVETVLNHYLSAVCLDNFDDFLRHCEQLPQANLTLLSTNAPVDNHPESSLLSKIKAPFGLQTWIQDIFVADTLDAARQKLSQLNSHQSVITKEGVWIGKGWLSIAHKTDVQSGVIQREREIHSLQEQLKSVGTQINDLHQAINQNKEELLAKDQHKEVLQKQLHDLVGSQAEAKSKQQVQQARLNQINQRKAQIEKEINESEQVLKSDQQSEEEIQQTLSQHQSLVEQFATQKEQFLSLRNELQAKLEMAKQKVQADQQASHQIALELQAIQMQFETAEQNKARLVTHVQELKNRKAFLENALSESIEPLTLAKDNLRDLDQEKQQLKQKVDLAKQEADQLEQELIILEQRRQTIDQELLNQRNQLEQLRISAQADSVRVKNLEEQIGETGHELSKTLEELPADINDVSWDEKLSQVIRKIERLGAINLAAIDEYHVQAERKDYLDKQYTDLTEALAALEDAMQKMDKETKNLFQETYDKINSNFQNLFPTLFGGGRASLQLDIGDDLLDAGITVMAQPPGKRNSSIHLLSGGEKALTAISLVFAMFQLNPAPFCMLDEVDAPLDDANVVRFCNLVKHMSASVQFIFISHNKLAIEMAEQLAGVTMHEPGVSRLVSVNVEEAIAMATA